MAANVVLAALKHVWATLESTGCQRALMGGLSLSIWRHFRSTHDVDLLIDPRPVGVDAMLEALGKAGIRTKHQPPVVDLGSVRILQLLYEPKDAFLEIQIDLLLAESPFHREALVRRVPVRLADVDLELSTLSCEDILILKMTAGRIIDRADAAALLRLNRAELDQAYLLKWVVQLKLGIEWAEIWNEAFPGEPVPGTS
ncbi:MAG TPA: nucleotidyl transferase AbiEii/AbiGii toxin family protein [Gemmataceae bacterium]|nr:nucleotidyl transferase AbiEii/AbiGii toxin family protein [Gemmataceae bacterium]